MQNVFTKEAGMTNYQIKDLKYHDNKNKNHTIAVEKGGRVNHYCR